MIYTLTIDECPNCKSYKIDVDKLKHILKCKHCRKKYNYSFIIRHDGSIVYIFTEVKRF